ncbi:MAG: ABC transporter permease subunit [bacterium]|nr:ABC transporter permease subunit [bacterium]
MAERHGRMRPPSPLGRRGATLLTIVAAAALAWWALDLSLAQLVPGAGGAQIASEFFAGALRPALTYQGDWIPPGSPPFLVTVLVALGKTLVFAAAAMSLALVFGLPLGVLASDAWWRRRPRWTRTLQVAVRTGIALQRSVHELLWAVIFLAALGLNTFAAVVAIALPYAGTLAKVFSEMLDEAPRNTAEALRSVGARPLEAFLYGLLPRAVPDLAAYAFYRFECSVRSSAVLGFFGYPTLGYHLALSFTNLHYREVWTYLYALIATSVVLEAWSAALRRRLVA